MSTWGDGIARSWTAVYTRGLPPEAAERRLEEIRSDLFEHASFAGRDDGPTSPRSRSGAVGHPRRPVLAAGRPSVA